MPRTNTTKKPMSQSAAEQAVWDAAADGTAEDLRKLAESEDENVMAAYDDFGARIADLGASQLAGGQQVLQMGRRNKFAGNFMAASEAYSHGKNVKEVATYGVTAGKWIASKVGNLIG